MHPERAVRGDAIEAQLRLGEGLLDLAGGLEALAALQHVVRGLGAGRTGFFGVSQKLREALGAVLSALNGGMINRLCHRNPRVLGDGESDCKLPGGRTRKDFENVKGEP
jgi:hypothetical protein